MALSMKRPMLPVHPHACGENLVYDAAKLAAPGTPLTELLVLAGLAPSKGQARKDLEAGGISLNNQRVTEVARCVSTTDLLFGKYVLLRKGKRTYAVLRLAA